MPDQSSNPYGAPQESGQPYSAPRESSSENGVPHEENGVPREENPGFPQQEYGAVAPYGNQPLSYPAAPFRMGPVGQVRSTGMAILLFVVTFGIYGLYWFYVVHDEMKRHKGTGIGGGLALVIAFFATAVTAFLTSSEVGELYERQGRAKPVSAITGLWYVPGNFILVGPIVWFVQTNGALNDYWRSVGAH